MKILIVSDTHGKNLNLERVLEYVPSIDLLIHLGDIEGSEDFIEAIAPCPVEMVAGNNDFFSSLPREKVIYLGERHKAFICHGQFYYVNFGTSRIEEEAKSRGCDIVIFGHTHRPLIEKNGDFWCLNPGSLSFPRQENRRPSYIIMEIDENDEIKAVVNYY